MKDAIKLRDACLVLFHTLQVSQVSLLAKSHAPHTAEHHARQGHPQL
jgi:hypothetical protein